MNFTARSSLLSSLLPDRSLMWWSLGIDRVILNGKSSQRLITRQSSGKVILSAFKDEWNNNNGSISFTFSPEENPFSKCTFTDILTHRCDVVICGQVSLWSGHKYTDLIIIITVMIVFPPKATKCIPQPLSSLFTFSGANRNGHLLHRRLIYWRVLSMGYKLW